MGLNPGIFVREHHASESIVLLFFFEYDRRFGCIHFKRTFFRYEKLLCYIMGSIVTFLDTPLSLYAQHYNI